MDNFEKQIGNFTITDKGDTVVVDYDKTLKDWFDTFLDISIGTFLSVAIFFFIKLGFESSSYVLIGIGLIFSIVAFMKWELGISRLLNPSRNLLVIHKSSKMLVLKTNLFTSKTFSVNEIRSLIVKGQNENVGSVNHRMISTCCTVTAKLKNGKYEQLFIVNTNRFIRPSSQKLETELYLIAKGLTNELNKHLKLKHTWTGFSEVE